MHLDIVSIFSHHPPEAEYISEAHESVRDGCRTLAMKWNAFLPDSAEKTLAIRHLQQAMMFANSAIAQYGTAE
jgi:hypothetical protein